MLNALGQRLHYTRCRRCPLQGAAAARHVRLSPHQRGPTAVQAVAEQKTGSSSNAAGFVSAAQKLPEVLKDEKSPEWFFTETGQKGWVSWPPPCVFTQEAKLINSSMECSWHIAYGVLLTWAP